MTEEAFQREVVAFMARTDEQLRNLRCPEHQAEMLALHERQIKLHERVNIIDKTVAVHKAGLMGLFTGGSVIGGLLVKYLPAVWR